MKENRPPPLDLSSWEKGVLVKHDGALRRIAAIAARAGASPDDIYTARAWPLFWLFEISRRHELESLADIGRKVSNSRAADRSALLERDFEVAACACKLLGAGAKHRGLARKIKSELKCSESVRHINRILNRWMPLVLSDFGRNRTHL